jgi:hypothetical protein
MQKFTPNDLLLYIFKETDPHKSNEIKDAILMDIDVQNEFHQMQTLLHELENAPVNDLILPSDGFIDSIVKQCVTVKESVVA